MMTRHSERRVYFVLPDFAEPSWGIGMILHLAEISRSMGITAYTLSEEAGFHLPWIDVKMSHLSWDKVHAMDENDLLIIPEIMADHPRAVNLKVRKVVFVQNGFMIKKGMGNARSYSDLGYSGAVVVMDHLSEILSSFWPIPTHRVTCFIPDYFFDRPQPRPARDRTRQILLFPKPVYEKAGYQDYEILHSLLQDFLLEHNKNSGGQAWRMVALKEKTHREVAALMKDAVFLINTNCFESLNATVAEAMAAGCIVFCYEAYGGMDYLKDEENAFVFQNNYIYSLLKKLQEYVANFEKYASSLQTMQIAARKDIEPFSKQQAKNDLMRFYADYGFLKDRIST